MRSTFFFATTLFILLTPTLRAQSVKDSLSLPIKETPQQPAPQPVSPTAPSSPSTPNTPEKVAPATPRTTYQPKSPDNYRFANRTRKRVPGFRIQVYTGDNTRVSKQKALDLKTHIQQLCPELSVYIHFQSPRWICRVGDFVSRAEAQPYLKKIRRHNLAPETSIVACPVLRAY